MNKPHANWYYCNGCGKVQKRYSEKQWISSYCEKSGKNVRMMRVPMDSPRFNLRTYETD